jgi:hypothetical protein
MPLPSADHPGFVSTRKGRREVGTGARAGLAYQPQGLERPIGLTKRAGWQPTQAQADMAQADMAQALRAVSR